GDTISARGDFNQAARAFSRARDDLDSPTLSGSLAVPYAASNVRAARALAEIGADLSNAGESVALAVDPDTLSVVDGRLPIETIARVAPTPPGGSAVLTRSLSRIDEIRAEPSLAAPVRDAIDRLYSQLARAEREARHAADTANLAGAIFGGDG